MNALEKSPIFSSVHISKPVEILKKSHEIAEKFREIFEVILIAIFVARSTAYLFEFGAIRATFIFELKSLENDGNNKMQRTFVLSNYDSLN